MRTVGALRTLYKTEVVLQGLGTALTMLDGKSKGGRQNRSDDNNSNQDMRHTPTDNDYSYVEFDDEPPF